MTDCLAQPLAGRHRRQPMQEGTAAHRGVTVIEYTCD
ncbi:hypothetical protein SAMN05216588_13611 [Pseudomonas flavescens]|uniref:Uncharacterized protein n=1 Tax=Phytopseudomonas flavescens TaxID=29435 RepID=A0A1G8QIL3_9GAMM|nr:hypothetical protein SAMN05216588_13611 [Pseudomonas flavescens]